ncbi:sppA [Scenedesmus sp. PABB004]|nr:sppA [Scenedesmus sp. PABB004]
MRPWGSSKAAAAASTSVSRTARASMDPAPAPPAPPAPAAGRPDLWAAARGAWRGAGRAAAALFVFSAGSALYAKYRAWQEFVSLPPAFYLEVDLETQTLVERASSSPLALLAGAHQLELAALVGALSDAKRDARVRGVLAVLGGREQFGGLAQLQELRNALLDFRFHTRGRAPIYAYSNAFGEGGTNGTAVFYLASAADKVFMPPTSVLSLLGFESTQVFVRGLLDRLKVQPQVFRREEYKAALAPLTGTGFDAAHRANLESLLQSLYDGVVTGVASARRLPRGAVEAAIADAPLPPQRALAAQLVDGLLYRDQVEALMLARMPEDVQRRLAEARSAAAAKPGAPPPSALALAGPRVSLQRFSLATQWAKSRAELWGGGAGDGSGSGAGAGAAPAGAAAPGGPPAAARALGGASAADAGGAEPPSGLPQLLALPRGAGGARGGGAKPAVVVVSAVGPIIQAAAGGGGAGGGEGSVESHKLVRALRGMRENPQVKAVVLRVSSPGGSAVASDMIAREVELLVAAGKPVVACMGDVAASGGYYISAPASRILAQPGTITGSIGVIFAKFKLDEALAQVGVTGDAVTRGDNADWASPFRELTPKQLQQVEGQIDNTYASFLDVVARGRGLARDNVRALAKGRVWSGAQALEAGLVDELGGVARAVEVAKELAGLPEDPAATTLVDWPPKRVPPLVMLLKGAGALPGSDPVGGTWWGGGGGGGEGGALRAAAAAAAARAAAAAGAAAEMLALFATHAWQLGDSDGSADGAHDAAGALAGLGLPAQQRRQALLAAGAAAAGGDAAALAAAAAAGLAAAAQPGALPSMRGPELLCVEAAALAYSC